jgi:hypothetical protein
MRPGQDGVSVRLAVVILLAWAWGSSLAEGLLAEPATTDPVDAEHRSAATRTARPGPGSR